MFTAGHLSTKSTMKMIYMVMNMRSLGSNPENSRRMQMKIRAESQSVITAKE